MTLGQDRDSSTQTRVKTVPVTKVTCKKLGSSKKGHQPGMPGVNTTGSIHKGVKMANRHYDGHQEQVRGTRGAVAELLKHGGIINAYTCITISGKRLAKVCR